MHSPTMLQSTKFFNVKGLSNFTITRLKSNINDAFAVMHIKVISSKNNTQLLQNKIPKAKLVPGSKVRNSCCSLEDIRNSAMHRRCHIISIVPRVCSIQLFSCYMETGSHQQHLRWHLQICTARCLYLFDHSNITI